MHKQSGLAMLLSLSQLIDAFFGHNLVISDAFRAGDAKFSGIELFTGQHSKQGILYITDPPEHPLPPEGTFLVAGAKEADSRYDLIVPDMGSVEAVNIIFCYYSALASALETMRETYYGHHDLSAFCQALSAFVGNPVVAYDASLLPAGQSDISHDQALELFGSERADRDFVLRTIPDWKREEGMNVFLARGARHISDASGKVTTAACNIITENRFEGYLEIFEANKAVTKGEMVLLEHATKILETAPYSLGEDELLRDYLEGRFTNEGLTTRWLTTLRWEPDDPIYVMAIHSPKAQGESKLLLDHLLRMLRLVAPEVICRTMNDMLVLIANERLSRQEKTLKDITALLARTDDQACLGVSETTTGTDLLHEGYEHAIFAAHYCFQVGRSRVLRFEECWFSYFEETCGLEGRESLVTTEAVQRMYEDDLATGSENTLTVKVYIESGFNLNATAKRLALHRNTVAYRLARIQKRYGINSTAPIEDEGLVFRTLLSCRLLLARKSCEDQRHAIGQPAR